MVLDDQPDGLLNPTDQPDVSAAPQVQLRVRVDLEGGSSSNLAVVSLEEVLQPPRAHAEVRCAKGDRPRSLIVTSFGSTGPDELPLASLRLWRLGQRSQGVTASQPSIDKGGGGTVPSRDVASAAFPLGGLGPGRHAWHVTLGSERFFTPTSGEFEAPITPGCRGQPTPVARP